MAALTLYHFAEEAERLAFNRKAEMIARRLGKFEWAVRSQQAADRIEETLRASKEFQQWIQFLEQREEKT